MSYRLSHRAEADLAEIWDYSAERWDAAQADRYIDALMSRFVWITENSALWKPRPDLAEGLYSYPQQSHMIYFRTCADVRGPDRDRPRAARADGAGQAHLVVASGKHRSAIVKQLP